MDTLQATDTSTPKVKDNLNTWTGGYTQIPNSILRASNLDSDSKVALALLYMTYTYALDNNQLEPDGSFYHTNARFDEFMAISGDQVIRKVIPDLVDKGLIRTIKRCVEGKTRNYYILDFNAINNYDGSAVDQKVLQKKLARAQKAYDGRRQKEAKIMKAYGEKVSELITDGYSIDSREKQIDIISDEIAKEYNYRFATAKGLVNRMINQYKSTTGKMPDWFVEPEDDELPF